MQEVILQDVLLNQNDNICVNHSNNKYGKFLKSVEKYMNRKNTT